MMRGEKLCRCSAKSTDNVIIQQWQCSASCTDSGVNIIQVKSVLKENRAESRNTLHIRTFGGGRWLLCFGVPATLRPIG